MRRIFLALIILVFVSVVIVKASRAYLSDTETSNTNTATAGTLILNLSAGTLSETSPSTVSNLTPGGSARKTLVLQNAGTVNISQIYITSVYLSGSSPLYNKLGLRVYDGGTLLLDTNLKDFNNFQTGLGTKDIEIYLPANADGTYQNLTATWKFNFEGR